MRKCEKCGAALVAGENWFTMRCENVCTKCKPVNYLAPRRMNSSLQIDRGDYESAILARQETEFD